MSARGIDPDEVFRALADPTRRAILARLRAGEAAAGEIASSFDVSRPAVSRHMRVLRRARLVRVRRDGRRRVYALNPRPLRAVDRWLTDYRVFWRARLDELRWHVESSDASDA